MSNLTKNRINRILDETAMTNALAAITNLAAQLPEHFSSDAPIYTTKDELIESLQEENKQLTTQVTTLQSVLNSPQKN
ncbi:MAG: UDP-N-acetylmuramyl pentapeptide synthase [Flavobacteriaceae bacterium]